MPPNNIKHLDKNKHYLGHFIGLNISDNVLKTVDIKTSKMQLQYVLILLVPFMHRTSALGQDASDSTSVEDQKLELPNAQKSSSKGKRNTFFCLNYYDHIIHRNGTTM